MSIKFSWEEITLFEMKKIMITNIFEDFECVYSKISNVNILIKEIHQCIDIFTFKEKKIWMKTYHDIILINYDRFKDVDMMIMMNIWLWYYLQSINMMIKWWIIWL